MNVVTIQINDFAPLHSSRFVVEWVHSAFEARHLEGTSHDPLIIQNVIMIHDAISAEAYNK